MVRSQLGTVEPITAPENGDWNHRSELSLTDRQESISKVIEEERHGEVVLPEFAQRDENEHREESASKDLSTSEEEEKKRAKYAAKYDHYRD